MEEKKINQNLETVEDERDNIEETEKVGTQANANKDEGKAEKTFTQEEVNAILTKEKKKMPTSEELKAFREWKENQKTAEEKQAEKETEYKNTLSKNESLEKENQTLKAGVTIEDLDYVVFKVSKMEGNFEENLLSFLEDNPKYLSSNKEEVTKTIDLGGEHKETNAPDLSKMSYEEYKAYRKSKK